MAKNDKNLDPGKDTDLPPESGPKKMNYVCIRKCFFRGRLWIPRHKAALKKDYHLSLPEGIKVDEKNFMRVDVVPEPLKVKEKGSTLADLKTDHFLS